MLKRTGRIIGNWDVSRSFTVANSSSGWVDMGAVQFNASMHWQGPSLPFPMKILFQGWDLDPESSIATERENSVSCLDAWFRSSGPRYEVLLCYDDEVRFLPCTIHLGFSRYGAPRMYHFLPGWVDIGSQCNTYVSQAVGNSYPVRHCTARRILRGLISIIP